MKICITGHTAGIGKAFAEVLGDRGHDIVGLSKRDGHNIRNIPKILEHIKPCDMWINNAQSGFAQTELFYAVWNHWQKTEKTIWVISTAMTQDYDIANVETMKQSDILEYRTQKRALEEAVHSVKQISTLPRVCIIRPGKVATQPGEVAHQQGADASEWANTVVNMYNQCREYQLLPSELSLIYSKNAPNL